MTKPLWDVRNVTDFKDLLTQSAELFGDKDAYRIKNSDGEYYGITYKKLPWLYNILQNTTYAAESSKDAKIILVNFLNLV